jgi:hypothetical protein
MARFDTRQIPIAGRVYTSADGAQTGLDEGFLYCEQDTELSAITYAAGGNIDPSNRRLNKVYAAGVELHGKIVGFTVASGQVLHVRG